MVNQLSPIGDQVFLEEPPEIRAAEGLLIKSPRAVGDPLLVLHKGPRAGEDFSVGDRVILDGRPGIVLRVDGIPIRIAKASDIILVVSPFEACEVSSDKTVEQGKRELDVREARK